MNVKLIENIDYYLDKAGNMVFTREYHLKRGHCCQSGCRHCPYKTLDPHTPQEFNSPWSDDSTYSGDFEEDSDNDDD